MKSKYLIPLSFLLLSACNQNIQQIHTKNKNAEFKIPVPENNSVENLPVIPKLQRAYSASIVIYDYDNDKAGSGVLVGKSKNGYLVFLSAFHVVEDAIKQAISKKEKIPKINIRFLKKSNFIRVIPLYFSIEKDLILLISTNKFPENKILPVEVSDKFPLLGETIWAIGNPASTTGNITKGTLSNIIVDELFTVHYRTDIDIYLGNSGGGLFNNKGQLVGISHAMEYSGSWINGKIIPGGGHFIALPTINKFMVDAVNEINK